MLSSQRFHEGDHDLVWLVEMTGREECIPVLFSAAPNMVQPVRAVGQGAIEIDEYIHKVKLPIASAHSFTRYKAYVIAALQVRARHR